MDYSQTLQTAEQILTPWDGVISHPSPERLDVAIQEKALKPAVKALVDARWGYLAAITGLDHPGAAGPAPDEQRWQRVSEEGEPEAAGGVEKEGTLEVLYHFCQGACVLTLRVSVRYSSAALPSICDLVPTATLFEREMIEMFGITLVGTPNTDKLLLPDDWPDGVFPLRKSFQGFGGAAEQEKDSE